MIRNFKVISLFTYTILVVFGVWVSAMVFGMIIAVIDIYFYEGGLPFAEPSTALGPLLYIYSRSLPYVVGASVVLGVSLGWQKGSKLHRASVDGMLPYQKEKQLYRMFVIAILICAVAVITFAQSRYSSYTQESSSKAVTDLRDKINSIGTFVVQEKNDHFNATFTTTGGVPGTYKISSFVTSGADSGMIRVAKEELVTLSQEVYSKEFHITHKEIVDQYVSNKIPGKGAFGSDENLVFSISLELIDDSEGLMSRYTKYNTQTLPPFSSQKSQSFPRSLYCSSSFECEIRPQKPTTQQQMYHNSTAGFELQYPSLFVVVPTSVDTVKLSPRDSENDFLGSPLFTITVPAQKVASEQSVFEYMQTREPTKRENYTQSPLGVYTLYTAENADPIEYIIHDPIWDRIAIVQSSDYTKKYTNSLQGVIESIRFSGSFSHCEVDDDCTLIRTGCTTTCPSKAVNKHDKERFEPDCSKYSGPAFESLCVAVIPQCNKGYCSAEKEQEIHINQLESLAQCDFGKYTGKGCKEGYMCFKGFDRPCGPPTGPEDTCLENAREVGDGLCHQICETKNDCSTDYQCVYKEAFIDDVQVVHHNMCV